MSMTSRPVLSLAVVALLGGCSFSFRTSSETGNGPETAARAFLQRIPSEGAAAAYATAAPQMYRSVGRNAFRAMVLSFGLDRYQSVTFTDSKLASDGTLLLSGTLYEQGAIGMPISVRMIGNQSAWQVIALDLHQIGNDRVGEGAAEGIALGTKLVTAVELAADCNRLAAPVRVPVCAHAIPFENGASGECVGEQANRMVAVTATLNNVDPVARTMTVDCRLSN